MNFDAALTVLSAAYANADGSAAVVVTDEIGAVALSAVDTPEQWAALLALDLPIAAYVAPVAPEVAPAVPTTEQIRAALRYQGKTDQQIDALFELAGAI